MNTADYKHARFNMIEQHVRTAEVLEHNVLDIIGQLPRETFVPEGYASLAFCDTNIPLAHGQCMMKPIQEGRMLQALDIQEQDRILEIGTGSGYVTAMLAQLGKHVISIDIHKEFQEAAQAALSTQGITNVTLETGDASKGWDAQAPYDVIAVTGSMPLLADELKQQLTIGGRMYVILGNVSPMSATLVTRISENQWSEKALYETEMPALDNVEQPSAFVF